MSQIYIYFALESSSDGYDEGVGTILVEKNGRGEIEYVLERALLKVNDDDSKWWQIHQTTKYTTLFYEVLVSPEGIPLKIRTIHPKTGEYAEAVPRIAVQYTEDKKGLLMRLEKKKDAEINLIGWGSTKGPALEALKHLKEEGIRARFIQIIYLEPFPKETLDELLKNNREFILLETNRTAQLGKLILQNNGFNFKHKILRYDGRPFLISQIIEKVKEVL